MALRSRRIRRILKRIQGGLITALAEAMQKRSELETGEPIRDLYPQIAYIVRP